MMPPTLLFPHEDLLYPTHTTPELRRMDMYNRARRAEIDSQIYTMNQRHTGRVGGSRRDAGDTLTFAGIFQAVRNGIGSMLITAGNRIQNPA